MNQQQAQTTTDDPNAEGVGDGAGTSETANAGAGDDATKKDTIVPDEVDVLRRENDQLRNEADHFRRAHDTHAGKVGPELDELRRRVRRYEAGGSSGSTDFDDPSEGRQATTEPIADPRVEVLLDREKVKAEREDRTVAQAALNMAVANFDAQFPNLEPAIADDIGKYFRENQATVMAEVEKGAADRVGFETERLLTRAMKHAIEQQRKRNSSSEKERQDKLVAQKRDATTPGRQGPGTGARRGGSPVTEAASLDEIKEELKRRGRRGF